MLRALVLNRLFLLTIGTAFAVVLLEVGVRVLFAIRVGPDVLFFGSSYCCGPMAQMAFDPKGAEAVLTETSHTVHTPELVGADYYKYAPNQTRLDYGIDGNTFAVRINNHGFRGDDFSMQRRADVIRVIALGASSTFGYRAEDHETYPVFMEEILTRRVADLGCREFESFEVINLGIPHLWTGQIVALLEDEGIPLDPQVVTLYAGMNDSKPSSGIRQRPGEYNLDINDNNIEEKPRLLRFAYENFVRGLKDTLITAALLDNVIHVSYTTFPASVSTDYSRKKLEEFITNVASMDRTAKKAGAIFIAANQQAHHSSHEKPERGVTYQDELEGLAERLREGGWINIGELKFVTHSKLMERLKAWAGKSSVSFVDVVAATDSRRDLMASYVHLSPAVNRIAAEAFADEVWAQTCDLGGATGS